MWMCVDVWVDDGYGLVNEIYIIDRYLARFVCARIFSFDF